MLLIRFFSCYFLFCGFFWLFSGVFLWLFCWLVCVDFCGFDGVMFWVGLWNGLWLRFARMARLSILLLVREVLDIEDSDYVRVQNGDDQKI